MRRFILSSFIVFSFFLIQIRTQAQNNKVEIQTLTQRVDSLENELSFLKLKYDIRNLGSDIKMLHNSVQIQVMDLQTDFKQRVFNNSNLKFYQTFYESSRDTRDWLSKLLEKQRELCDKMVMVYHFSESELDILSSTFDVIDFDLERLTKAIRFFGDVLTIYQDATELYKSS